LFKKQRQQHREGLRLNSPVEQLVIPEFRARVLINFHVPVMKDGIKRIII